MHVYKPPPVGGLDRVPVFTAGTGSTRADLFELDGVTPMPGNVLVADTSGNLPSFQCATSPVYVGTSGSRTTWQPNESGDPTPSAASGGSAPYIHMYSDDGPHSLAGATFTSWDVVHDAGGTALTVDAVAGTITVNETGLYAVTILLYAVAVTTTGDLSVDDFNGFLVDYRHLTAPFSGGGITISGVVPETAGTVLSADIFSVNTLVGTCGKVVMVVAQLAKA